MTEYEMASLHSALFVQAQMSLMTFVTVVTGFLIASYLAAHRISRSMIVIALGIYLVFAAFNLLGFYRTLETYAGLSMEMKAFAAAGKGLSWHGAIALSEWGAAALPIGGVLISALSVVASLLFLFHSRRANTKAQADPRPQG